MLITLRNILALILVPLHLYASTIVSSDEDDDLRMTQMRLLKQTVQTGQDFSKTPSTGDLHELSLAETATPISRKPNVSTSLLSDPESLRQKSRPLDLNIMQIGLLTVDIPFEITALGCSLVSGIYPSSVTTLGDLVLTGAVTLTRGVLTCSLIKSQDTWLRILAGVPLSSSLLNCVMSSCNYSVDGALSPLPFIVQCIFVVPTLVTLYTMIRLQNYKKDEYDLCCRDHECDGD